MKVVIAGLDFHEYDLINVLLVHTLEDQEVDRPADEAASDALRSFGKSGRNGATYSEKTPP
jgi:hypothetical protein